MNNASVYNKIRQTVQGRLPGSRVLLFGSRARGDQDRHSDYDLLAITPKTFTPQEKADMSRQLDRAIVEAIRAPVDVLLNSEEEIREKMELPGHIVRTALREGVIL